jgi:hypothetical protein
MDEVAKIVTGLRIKLPSISLEELLALENPTVRREAHVSAEVGKDYWIYSVGGSLVEGEAIVTRASKFFPHIAETFAQEGLMDTIKSLKKFNANTGLQATVEVKGL